MKELKTGMVGNAKCIVNKQNTANAVGSGELEVFGTPMMIALMEQATCQCISECMENDETTVGTKIEIFHTSPSVVGKNIFAKAMLTQIAGRRLTFEVSANDDNGEIGSGKIERFLVFGEKFCERAKCK